MSLIGMAKEITRRAHSLREAGALRQHLGDVVYVREHIEKETLATRHAVRSIRGLRLIGAAPRLPSDEVTKAATTIENLLEGEKALVLKPSGSLPALQDTKEIRQNVTREIKKSHGAWRESVLAELEPIVGFADAVRQVWPDVHRQLMGLVFNVKRNVGDLATKESVGAVLAAMDELRKTLGGVAPTEETRRFVVAACDTGAKFKDLTTPVSEWLRDRNLENRLRIRISGTNDD